MDIAGRKPIGFKLVNNLTLLASAQATRGALLEFSGRAPTTDSLHLKIANIGFDGDCVVKHRSSRVIGVQF